MPDPNDGTNPHWNRSWWLGLRRRRGRPEIKLDDAEIMATGRSSGSQRRDAMLRARPAGIALMPADLGTTLAKLLA